MGFMDDVFNSGGNGWNPWMAQIAENNRIAAEQAAAAEQQRQAQAAAAQQAAQQAQQQAAAAPPPPPAPVFNPTPFQGIVDAGFSQFTPEWYANKYQEAYSPYKSGVETQFGGASDRLTAGLAKKGLGGSSQGRGLFQQLEALRDQEFTKGQGAAEGWQTGLKTQVGAAKDNLYGSIGEGKDNASIGDRTKAATDPIYGAKPPASTLGEDVFGGLVEPYAAAKSPGGPSNPSDMAFATGGNLNLAGGAGGPEASTKVLGGKKKK